jgi:hypothetical protein
MKAWRMRLMLGTSEALRSKLSTRFSGRLLGEPKTLHGTIAPLISKAQRAKPRIMDQIIEKISTYNIFTNLFPGLIYCYLMDNLYGTQFLQDDLLIGIFGYYFIGMAISRVGSLIVEPALILLKLVEYADYPSYVSAAKEDHKLDTLLETNNSYRSMLSLLFCVGLTALWFSMTAAFPLLQSYSKHAVASLLFLLFLFSYRKQTRYISARVRLRVKQETN